MKGSEQTKLETFESFPEERRKSYDTFFKTPMDKLQTILQTIEYGKRLPEVWLEHREEEWNKTIAKAAGIQLQEAPQIMRVINNILRGLRRKRFIQQRSLDLKNLGYRDAEIKKFIKVAAQLRKNDGAPIMLKIDKWAAISEEVLPHLSFLEAAFDIRCDVRNGKVETFVPIILIKFSSTEKQNEPPKELVFQMGIGELRHFVKGISEMYRNIDVLKEYTVELRRKE